MSLSIPTVWERVYLLFAGPWMEISTTTKVISLAGRAKGQGGENKMYSLKNAAIATAFAPPAVLMYTIAGRHNQAFEIPNSEAVAGPTSQNKIRNERTAKASCDGPRHGNHSFVRTSPSPNMAPQNCLTSWIQIESFACFLLSPSLQGRTVR